MDKNLILVFIIVAVLGGAIWYQHRPSATHTPSLASVLASATGKTAGAPAAAATPAANPETLKKQAADRAAIENALSPMKVTSILLGDPAIVVINKKDYSVGDPLALPGKTLQITRIDEGGVTLAYSGQSFHLDAPGAPDLAASRKKL